MHCLFMLNKLRSGGLLRVLEPFYQDEGILIIHYAAFFG